MMCTIFGTFMTLLDTTIVNIALPKITSVFGMTMLFKTVPVPSGTR